MKPALTVKIQTLAALHKALRAAKRNETGQAGKVAVAVAGSLAKGLVGQKLDTLTEQLAKIAGDNDSLRAQLAKATNAYTSLEARLRKVERMPAAPKGKLLFIGAPGQNQELVTAGANGNERYVVRDDQGNINDVASLIKMAQAKPLE